MTIIWEYHPAEYGDMGCTMKDKVKIQKDVESIGFPCGK